MPMGRMIKQFKEWKRDIDQPIHLWIGQMAYIVIGQSTSFSAVVPVNSLSLAREPNTDAYTRMKTAPKMKMVPKK